MSEAIEELENTSTRDPQDPRRGDLRRGARRMQQGTLKRSPSVSPLLDHHHIDEP